MKCPIELPEGTRLLRRGETASLSDRILVQSPQSAGWNAVVLSRGRRCWNGEGRITRQNGETAWVVRDLPVEAGTYEVLIQVSFEKPTTLREIKEAAMEMLETSPVVLQ